MTEQEIPCADVAVMCGPSHAEEVGIGLPTTVVAGAKTESTAEKIQDLFMNEVFRVYTSPDMLGMELGGSLKNVIALAAGMADGLGYGDNTKAALITRGIYSAKAALALAKKYDVELPIIEEVNKVLFDDKPAKEGVKDLMVREKRVEHLNLKWEN